MSEREELKALIDKEMSKYDDKNEVKDVQEEVTEQEAEVPEVHNEVETKEESEPYLKEALEMGYNPNHQGPNKKTPEQFVKDGSFFRKIDELKKENKDIKSLLQQQIDRANKIEKQKLESKLNSIQQDKIQKVADGDLDGYRFSEDQEKAVQEQLKVHNVPVETTPAGNAISDTVKDFLEDNKAWCNFNTPKNKEMAEDMDYECRKIALRDPNMSEKEILDQAMIKVRKVHSDYFENSETKRPASVAKSTVSTSSNSSMEKLTTQQQKFLKDAKRYGLNISADEYIKQLKSSGELQ